MKFRFLIILFFYLGGTQLAAQNRLEELRIEAAQISKSQAQLALDYSIKNNVPLVSRDENGNLVLLIGVTENGIPLFETTDNAGAAITTGVPALQEGGGLGLNLQGEGVSLAIWDGGIVDDHIEFDNRILSREGTEEDGHATHVMGTILAKGINSAAKGMAPNASAFSFDFSNDTPEMLGLARPDQSSVILSNHSYGLVTGWRFNGGWQWFGDASISNQEDYNFGFYSSAARQWDQLAFNAPYYLIVKSAGNDRSDTGSGNFPPDCNGGSGYDCISDKSVAKNILTVGAVNKVLNYQGPASVVMSSFSGWGPTDDGRIKPDLVAAGVGLFSTTSSTTNNQYGTSNGTSMSAPNATGSLVLLQELNKNLTGGQYMRAATLKGLAIHTAKEAGLTPGPDYQFGWGVLDVEAAARLMLNQDNQNIYILEDVLAGGSTYELNLQPKENTKITATIVWTDPAGTPVGAALDPTNIMLVNDLDLRITDDAGNIQFPWILNPANPSEPAAKGDNIRDNVEKIEFDTPEPRGYKIVINHKGALNGGSQAFSLIVEYTSLNDPRQALYWIGEDGNWGDGVNWSLTSGGIPAGIIPGEQDRVIVDENSFSSAGQQIAFTNDAWCHSLTWLTKNESGILLNNNTLSIGAGLNVSSINFSVGNEGIIEFTGQNETANKLTLSSSDMSKAKLIFDGLEKSWEVIGTPTMGSISVLAGELSLRDIEISVDQILMQSAEICRLDIRGAALLNVKLLSLTGSNINLISSSSSFIRSFSQESSALNFGTMDYSGAIQMIGSGSLNGTGNLFDVFLSGAIEILGNNKFEELEIESGSEIVLLSGTTTVITEMTAIHASESNRTIIRSNNSAPATIRGDGHFKLCFDYLDISDVNIAGDAVINAGLNSLLTNTSNWLQNNCEDVLFPDFDFNFTCIGALTDFADKTSGIVTGWEWDFGDPASGDINSMIQNPFHIFSSEGTYSVTLTASNSAESRSYTQEVLIGANPIPANNIVPNNDQLFSFKSAESYLWYRDGLPINDSNNRSYTHQGEPGAYFVVTTVSNCNLPSSVYLISGLHSEIADQQFFRIYPNPANYELTIDVDEVDIKNTELEIISALGMRMVHFQVFQKRNVVDVSGFPEGIYFLTLKTSSGTSTKKIIVH